MIYINEEIQDPLSACNYQ